MPDWSAGYVADIGYTFGTYAELNPQRLALPLLMAGLAPPAIRTACELGFGQGVSINVHAAASDVEWHGTDFNPSQALFAAELAAASGANVHVHDQSFAEFCARTDLPDFDFIGLHGIFSWVSDENRRILVDFVRRKLRLGGVLYISYNTQPGWAAMAPLRDLLSDYCSLMCAPGGASTVRAGQALAFADQLFAVNPLYARVNPTVKARLDKLKEQDKAYVVHEYFNQDWTPMPFMQMARWLEPARLSFAGSAHYLDHIQPVNLTPEQQTLLAGIDDPLFQQSVRDFIVNQQFRRDYWVRGPRRLGNRAQQEAMLDCRVALVVPRDMVTLKTTSPRGEIELSGAIYQPVLDVLEDMAPHSIRDIVARCVNDTVKLPQVLQAVFVLAGLGKAAPLQDDAAIERARPRARALNLHLCERALHNNNVRDLAMPATGGALGVDRFQQMFVLARERGAQTAEEWAAFASQALTEHGEHIVVEGKPVTAPALQLQELARRAVIWRDRGLPAVLRLGGL